MAAKPRPSKIGIGVEIVGALETAAVMERIGERAYKTRPLMERGLVMLQRSQAARMEKAPWKPLTAQTTSRKIRQGEIPELMRDESRPIGGQPTRAPDAVYYGVTQPSFPGQIKLVTRTMATFGLDSKGKGPFFYARFVQNVKGTQRRLMAIDIDTAVAFTNMVLYWLIFDETKARR